MLSSEVIVYFWQYNPKYFTEQLFQQTKISDSYFFLYINKSHFIPSNSSSITMFCP